MNKSNIGLKKISAEAGSAVLIKDDSRCSIKNYRSRVIRSATLDGGAVIENLGFSNGDRTITIVTEQDEVILEKIKSLIVDELFLLVSTRDGVFYGAAESLVADRGQITLNFLVKEKDNE